MPDAPTEHFAFTKLLVADLERSAAFYEGVFGFQPVGRVHSAIASRKIDEIMYRATGAGGASFVLLRFTGTAAPRSDEVILGFTTTDMDALVERAIAAGGSLVQEAYDNTEHHVRVAFVADNEGHLIELVQRMG